MDKNGLPIPSSEDIIQALQLSGSFGEVIKKHLGENFDKTMARLEGLSPETISTVIRGESESPDTFIQAIDDVRAFVCNILQKGHQPSHAASLKNITKQLNSTLGNVAHVSPESLSLICAYFQEFKSKYPPRRLYDWESTATEHNQWQNYDDSMSQNYDPVDGHYISKQDIEEEEKTALRLSVRSIKCYTAYLYSTIVGHQSAEGAKRNAEIESNQINTMKQIMNTVREMLDWRDSYAPYNELCTPGEVLGYNVMEIDIFDTVGTWENILKCLTDLGKK